MGWLYACAMLFEVRLWYAWMQGALCDAGHVLLRIELQKCDKFIKERMPCCI